MKMLNGYILIKVDQETTKTNTGILLQSTSVKLPSQGTVEQIADGIKDLQIGDRVEFLRYASLDGINENTRICTKEMILAKL